MDELPGQQEALKAVAASMAAILARLDAIEQRLTRIEKPHETTETAPAKSAQALAQEKVQRLIQSQAVAAEPKASPSPAVPPPIPAIINVPPAAVHATKEPESRYEDARPVTPAFAGSPVSSVELSIASSEP